MGNIIGKRRGRDDGHNAGETKPEPRKTSFREKAPSPLQVELSPLAEEILQCATLNAIAAKVLGNSACMVSDFASNKGITPKQVLKDNLAVIMIAYEKAGELTQYDIDAINAHIDGLDDDTPVGTPRSATASPVLPSPRGEPPLSTLREMAIARRMANQGAGGSQSTAHSRAASVSPVLAESGSQRTLSDGSSSPKSGPKKP